MTPCIASCIPTSPWSRRLWEEFSSAMVAEGGYLVFDDTTWRRWAEKAEAVSWVWSSSAAHIVRGVQAVLLVSTDGQVKVPVGMRLWQKGGQSKVALAGELLREARERGLEPKCVLFDSWYTAGALLNLLEAFGWKYVAHLKSNRLLDSVAVREQWPHRFGRGRGQLRKVSHEVLVVKDGRRTRQAVKAQPLSRHTQDKVINQPSLERVAQACRRPRRAHAVSHLTAAALEASVGQLLSPMISARWTRTAHGLTILLISLVQFA